MGFRNTAPPWLLSRSVADRIAILLIPISMISGFDSFSAMVLSQTSDLETYHFVGHNDARRTLSLKDFLALILNLTLPSVGNLV